VQKTFSLEGFKMANHCAKHDITGPECWCCEEEKLNATPGARELAYSDPAFLAKRGGAKAADVQQSKILNRLSQLTPEQLDRLIAVAGAGGAAPSKPAAGGGVRRQIA
jgi:hypothetical protein